MRNAGQSDADPIIENGQWLFPDGTRLPIASGGDGPEDEAPIERPESFDGMSADALRTLRDRAVVRHAAIQAQETITVADAREARRLAELANEIVPLYAEAIAPAPELVALPEPPAPVVTEPPVVEVPAAPAAVETPAEGGEQIPAPMAASAAGITVEDLPGTPAAPSPAGSEHQAPPAVFRAAAGGHEFDAGAELGWEEIGAIMAQATNLTTELAAQARRRGGDVSISPADREVRIASITFREPLPQAEVLSQYNHASVNSAIINGTAPPETEEERLAARTAAICGPYDIRRDIPNCIGHGRPIRGLFRQVPSERGAFQWIPSIGLASVAAGVTQWTDADQALVDEADPSTWKPCVPLTCAEVETAEVNRIPSCLTVEVMQQISTPEQVANWVDTIGAQTERVAEGVLLDEITALSSAYTFATGFYGAIPTLYNAVSYLLSLAADLNRQFDVSGYTLVYQSGFRRRIGLDSFARQFTAERELERLASDLGIRLVETLDFQFTGGTSPWAGSFPLNPAGAAPVVPAEAPLDWRFWLIDTRAGAFFSPDEFAFMMARDPQLLRQNRAQWFGELFEGILKQGCAPWFMFDINLCMNGDRAAGSEPIPCDNGSMPVGLDLANLTGVDASLAVEIGRSSAVEAIEQAKADAIAAVNEALAQLDVAGLHEAVAAAEAADAAGAKAAAKGK